MFQLNYPKVLWFSAFCSLIDRPYFDKVCEQRVLKLSMEIPLASSKGFFIIMISEIFTVFNYTKVKMVLYEFRCKCAFWR